jgi:transcriptional regulator with XRE-family HTH domain
MAKKYNNVSNLVKDISVNSKVREETLKEIRKTSLAKFLFYLRCDNKLTQGELAAKIDCSQSRISKIESSYDTDLTVKDLLDYGEALNLNLELGYRQKNAKITDLIKYHIIKAREYLTQLTDMVKGDESMNEGALDFIKELMFNVLGAVTINLQKLRFPKNVKEPKGQIHLSSPLHDKEVMHEDKLQKI